MYGGRSEEKEDVVYEHMEAILLLLQDGLLPESVRDETIYELMEQFLKGTRSGRRKLKIWKEMHP